MTQNEQISCSHTCSFFQLISANKESRARVDRQSFKIDLDVSLRWWMNDWSLKLWLCRVGQGRGVLAAEDQNDVILVSWRSKQCSNTTVQGRNLCCCGRKRNSWAGSKVVRMLLASLQIARLSCSNFTTGNCDWLVNCRIFSQLSWPSVVLSWKCGQWRLDTTHKKQIVCPCKAEQTKARCHCCPS